MTNDEKRGKFIAKLRREKGLTQQELGKIINYTDKAISKWEQGKSIPSVEVMKKLADIFDVKVLELMYGEIEDSENKIKIEDRAVDELTNNYHKYRKILFSIILTFLVVIVIGFIFIYFFFIRNSVIVYSVSGENENIVTKNGTLVISNKVSLFNFNMVESKNNMKIKNIRVYYLDRKGNEQLVFKGSNEDYFLEENNGYKDYNLSAIENNDTYVEVTYDNDEKESVKLELQRKYINDNVFPRLDDPVSNGKSQNKYDSAEIERKLISMGFKYDSTDYVYEINKNTTCYINSNTYSINILSYDKKVNYFFHSYIDSEEILFEEKNNKNEIIETRIITSNKEKDCINDKCSTEEDYSNFILFLKNKLS